MYNLPSIKNVSILFQVRCQYIFLQLAWIINNQLKLGQLPLCEMIKYNVSMHSIHYIVYHNYESTSTMNTNKLIVQPTIQSGNECSVVFPVCMQLTGHN